MELHTLKQLDTEDLPDTVSPAQWKLPTRLPARTEPRPGAGVRDATGLFNADDNSDR
jgi:hypothetical protein